MIEVMTTIIVSNLLITGDLIIIEVSVDGSLEPHLPFYNNHKPKIISILTIKYS